MSSWATGDGIERGSGFIQAIWTLPPVKSGPYKRLTGLVDVTGFSANQEEIGRKDGH